MLESIKKIIKDVASAPNLTEGLNTIVAGVSSAMGVDVCSVYLKQPETENFVLMATVGLNQEAVGRACLAVDEGLVSQVANRAEPVNLSNAIDHPNFRYISGTGEEGFRSFLGVPMIHYRKVVGVLVTQGVEQRNFTEDEVSFLMTTAAQLAEVITYSEVSDTIKAVRKGKRARAFSLKGIAGSTGISVGTVVVAYVPAELESVPDKQIEDIEKEIKALSHAVDATQKEIAELSERMKEFIPEEERLVFDVYVGMLDGGSLIDDTEERIRNGMWAPAALRDTIADHVRAFENMEDAYFRERASDVRDLGRRVLMHLQNEGGDLRKIPKDAILVGDEISPAQLAEIPRERLKGLVSVRGSATSHVSILAKALDIPAVLGVHELPLGLVEGRRMIVDGYGGRVFLDPARAVVREYNRLIREEAEQEDYLLAMKELPAVSPDGYEMKLYASTGLISDVNYSLEFGSEGIGLHRTEFPFMTRDRFPGEREQTEVYRSILEPFAPKPVVLRTLDIGGDKELPYFPVTDPNPFLGWRGIRITLDHPEIFATQLRAMLKANVGLGNLHILFPMISNLSELDESLLILDRVRRELLDEGVAVEMPKTGVLIEVPSAVYQAEAIARRVDFLSVGTNDLAQYLMAVDRNNPRVANLYDELHPAVLRALLQVADAGIRAKKPVSVCGSMAGDPVAAILLFALGFDSLSMTISSLLKVKWVIRTMTKSRAEELLGKALIMDFPSEIRSLLINALEEAGLGGLIRAGK